MAEDLVGDHARDAGVAEGSNDPGGQVDFADVLMQCRPEKVLRIAEWTACGVGVSQAVDPNAKPMAWP